MQRTLGHDLLSVYGLSCQDEDFLADLIDNRIASPLDTRTLFVDSLLAGAEEWFSVVQHTTSERASQSLRIRASRRPRTAHKRSPCIAETGICALPWATTGRLISIATDLVAQTSDGLPHSQELSKGSNKERRSAPISRKVLDKHTETSRFWLGEINDSSSTNDNKTITRHTSAIRQVQKRNRKRPAASPALVSGLADGTSDPKWSREGVESRLRSSIGEAGDGESLPLALTQARPPKRQASASPYFGDTTSSEGRTTSRPKPGTVSSVPFPPLSAPRFGLAQERQADEPFWLLIAVTFLIKTRGTVAIPIFEELKARFPGATHIANPANAQAITDMVRPLGLVKSRVAFLQRYARNFLDQPPKPGLRYRVRGYDQRDVSPARCQQSEADPNETAGMSDGNIHADADAWEIGHMTKGKYALDSWRIFCRDRLLGRAEDWNGKGREPEFQPEWMRVRPMDKELRAYLRWMWMREGWEWNPHTNERVVLRDEMRRAVDEQRVEYDDQGDLRILDQPRNP